MLDKAEFSAFESTLNSSVVSYRIVTDLNAVSAFKPRIQSSDSHSTICRTNSLYNLVSESSNKNQYSSKRMKVFTVNSFSYFKIRNNAMTMWNLPLALQLISGHWIFLRLSIKLIILHCYVAYNCLMGRLLPWNFIGVLLNWFTKCFFLYTVGQPPVLLVQHHSWRKTRWLPITHTVCYIHGCADW